MKHTTSFPQLHKTFQEKQFIGYLLNNINSLIFVADKNNNFLYTNDAVVKKYHYSHDEILQMKISDIDVNFDASKMDLFWEKLKIEKIIHLQSIHRNKEGTLYPVLIHAHYVEIKNMVYSFGVIEDESYIQKLLDAQNGLITLTDGKKLLMTNAQTLDFFGYSDFSSFTREHNCICDFFIEESGFISNKAGWMQKVMNMEDAKVKVKKANENEDYVFLVHISAFDEDRFIVTYTNITSLEHNKEHLEILAITDGMTSLYNRRYFNKILPTEMNRIKRERKQFAFIMLDIDFFKQYNDTYGHLKGDDVLITVALTIKKHFTRASDFCFRLGGEEFGVIFSFDSMEGLLQKVEHVRNSIEMLHIEHTNSSVSSFITVSIGVALSDGSDSAEKLYSKSDAQLYKAKETGRNKISFALI